MYSVFVDRDNVNDEIVLIVNIYVENNTKVKKGDVILDFETSKSVIEMTTPETGVVTLEVELGEEVDVGAKLFQIDPSDSKLLSSKSKIKKKETLAKNDKKASPYVFSKAALKKIEELKLKNLKFNKKFINEDDVIEFSNKVNKKSSKKKYKAEKKARNSQNDAKNRGSNTISKQISYSKKHEIEALSSVNKIGLVSTVFINVKAVDLNKSKELSTLSSSSYLPLVIFESSKLLKKYPALNSFFSNDEIHEYQQINIGVAIDIDDGLKVFTLYDTDKMDSNQIQDSLSQGLYKYLRKDLSVKELTGSTFTITDLSLYGIDRFIPLVNKNQSSILAISSVDKALDRFNLSMSFDHRVTEGKLTSEFLFELKQTIENFEPSN